MQIENQYLRVNVRELGAELTSILDKKDNTEHLWQADSAFWGWHAPVLFPVVGRCFGDKITVKGKEYPMEKHGFARKTKFHLVEHSTDYILLEITQTPETKKHFPFDFTFQIGYKLEGSLLNTCYTVLNPSSEELFFSLGGHPALAVPFFMDEQYGDYKIELEADTILQRHYIDEDGFFDGRKTEVLNGNNFIPLRGDLFTDDALIFKDLKSRTVFIRSKKHNKFVSFSFPTFNYLGLWAKPDAQYVCIEPWLGCADKAGYAGEFSRKEGIIHLAANQTFRAEFIIGIHD